MRIAICDDEKLTEENMKAEIKKAFSRISNMDVDIYTFEDARDMIESHAKKPFDTVFLDIDMPHISGFEAAEILQTNYNDIVLIFVTSHTYYIYNSSKFQPFRFMQKHSFIAEIEETLTEMLKYIEKKKDIYSYSFERNNYIVRISNIYYFKYFKNGVNIITKTGVSRHRRRLNDIEKEMEPYHFIRVHSGYLVNAQYISAWKNDYIKLSNGETIPLSRLREKEAKQKFAVYFRTLNKTH